MWAYYSGDLTVFKINHKTNFSDNFKKV